MGNAIRGPAKILIFSVIVCFLFLALGSTAQALVVQMERQEVIQRSNFIFVGNVLEKNARWNDQGNLIVTDYVFAVDDVLLGEVGSNQLTLTFAGGQLAEEGQSVSDVPEFEVEDLVLLMLEESAHPLFSPVTGGYQGKFVARNMDNSAEQVVDLTNDSNLAAFDGKNQAVRNDSGDAIAFEDFVEMVRNEIPVAKSKALPDRAVPQHLENLVIEDLPYQVYDPSSVMSSMSSETIAVSLPASAPQTDDILPENSMEVDLGDDGLDVEFSKGEAPEYYSYEHLASGRIVWNPLPNNYNHDQWQMSYWNKYGDIYRVMTSTGTWAWRNGRYDIAGWVNNATMISQFGQGWGSTTLAVCWSRWNSFTGIRIEADIAMNPAFSWTTNDCSTYYNSNLFNTHRTFLHEIGHGWGLNHQWYFLSVMNYAPHKYRAYNQLQVDDTAAIRAAYPYDVSRTDVGVFGYYANGFRNYDDSSVSPTTVNAGSTVTVSNFVIENAGTNTTAPSVRWYLVPNICSWSGNRYIGTTTHAALARNSFFNTSRTLTIPSDTPAGNYYLGAWIQSDSVGENNSTWIDRRITVVRPALAAEVVSLWPVGTKNQGETATLWARVQNTGGATLPSSARVYYWVTGPSWSGSNYVGSVSVGGLARSALGWYRFDWAIPANRTPGTHNYYARVWDTATGTWLGAWRGPQSFTVVAGISADVTSLWPVGTKVQGETAPLWALVRNTGGAALPASARVYYQVAGPDLNSYVGSVSVGGLAPGVSRWYLFNWAIPANRTPGTNNYWAQVWNTATGTWLGARRGPQSFTIVARRLSAEVRSLWPPGVVGCGGTASLWARVQNAGNTELPASARVYYYVRGPGLDGYVGSVSVGGLDPSALGWYRFIWSIPANRTPGTHNYWARVWDTATRTWLGDWRGPQSFLVTCLR